LSFIWIGRDINSRPTLISPHCGMSLFLREGAAEIAAWGRRIWVFSCDSKSCPSRDTGVLGTMRKEWQKRRSSQEQARGQVNQCSIVLGWPDLPRTITFVIGPGTRRKK
jgi:hypothetical protein